MPSDAAAPRDPEGTTFQHGVASDDPDRIYRRLPLGGLADLVMIDRRSWRDEQATPPETYDEERELLGQVYPHLITDRLGRLHTAWACHLMEDPTDRIEPLAVEFVTASITTQNLNEKIGDDERTRDVDIEGTSRLYHVADEDTDRDPRRAE